MEFFRGIGNPIGVKVSGKTNEEEFVELNRRLNPRNEKGKMMVIVRMGASVITAKLNMLI